MTSYRLQLQSRLQAFLKTLKSPGKDPSAQRVTTPANEDLIAEAISKGLIVTNQYNGLGEVIAPVGYSMYPGIAEARQQWSRDRAEARRQEQAWWARIEALLASKVPDGEVSGAPKEVSGALGEITGRSPSSGDAMMRLTRSGPYKDASKADPVEETPEPPPACPRWLQETDVPPVLARLWGDMEAELAARLSPPPRVSVSDTLNRDCWIRKIVVECEHPEWIQVASTTIAGIPINIGSKGMPSGAFRELTQGRRLVRSGQAVSITFYNMGPRPMLVTAGLVVDEMCSYLIQGVAEAGLMATMAGNGLGSARYT